jgi:hypothetical protein
MNELLRRWRALGIRDDYAVFAVVFVVLLVTLVVLSKRAYKQGETAAENRMLRGIIGETIVGNVDTAIGRDPGHHGL